MIATLIFVFIVSLLTSTATVEDEIISSSASDKDAKNCLLPPYPEHGRYTVSNYPFATPGDSYQRVKLDVSCDIGYQNNNTIKSILCVNGEWSATMPICVPDSLAFCKLKDELSIEYRCVSVPGSLECSQVIFYFLSVVPSGTVVRPICRFPAYFSLKALSEMHCRDGIWDYNPICKPACGLITQHQKLEGSSNNHLELPWHAVIYLKHSGLFYYFCGGSLISANKILTAARCFYDYDDLLRPANNFVAVVNKMYRSYYDPRDKNRQLSDVVDIKIPSSYRGRATDFEDNIAIAVVERPFIFHLSVRPVCLDFDSDLDKTQLTEGNTGKAALWNIDDDNIQKPRVLNVVDLPYTKREDCYDVFPTPYRSFLTKDKFCAASNTTWFRSTDDRGVGLAYLEATTQRYYLRGVVSESFPNPNITYSYIVTSVAKHEHFIKQYCTKCTVPNNTVPFYKTIMYHLINYSSQ